VTDEARLHDLLDLVEQARSEGDAATEAKAIAAYRRESAAAPTPGVLPAGGVAAPAVEKPNLATRASDALHETGLSPITDPLIGGAELAASGVTNLAGKAVGGAAGILQGGGEMLMNLFRDKKVDPMEAASQRIHQVEDALTYQPGARGQDLMRGVAGAAKTAYDKTGLPPLMPDTPLGQTLPPAAADLFASLSAAPGMVRGGVGALERTLPKAVEQAPVPTKELLKQQATAAYKRSEDIGAVVSAPKFDEFKTKLASDMEKSGIDSTLHPDATAALKRITSESGPVTLEKLETLRRIAQDAEKSIKPADANKAGDMVDAIDEMADGLKAGDLVSGTPDAVSALHEARDYWKRSRKADDLDELMRRAELSAPNFSASGMENAVRTEFRALAKNKRRFRQFSAEEQDAISKVAKGGPLQNTLRMIGKAAPTGIVSAGLGTGLGAALGGPVGAALVPAVGAASRYGASRMTLANARAANELVRRGQPLPMAPPVAAAQPLSGQLMPRPPLALPAPTIISGQRSAPGSMYAREQMGMTPDVERAGMQHPGMAHQRVPTPQPAPLALPYLPKEMAKPQAMVVDPQGRVASNAASLQDYLQAMGQGRMRNVRQPSAVPPKGGLFDPITAETAPTAAARQPRSKAEAQKEFLRLQMLVRSLSPEQLADQSYMQGLNREWNRLQVELKRRASPGASDSAGDSRKN
jgi:hypothetical protein